jgi:hypothetical protein
MSAYIDRQAEAEKEYAVRALQDLQNRTERALAAIYDDQRPFASMDGSLGLVELAASGERHTYAWLQAEVAKARP